MRKIVPRKIFPEDYELLREVVYKKNKTYIQVLEEIYLVAKLKIETFGMSYYINYEIPNSNYLLHKSIALPREFNEFLMMHSSKIFPAKHLLSAIIQDYIKVNIEITDK